MNEWIRIWHELSSGSSVFHEGERKWSNFCLFSDWFWLMSACGYWCLAIFPAWFDVTVAVFRPSVSNGCRRKTARSFCAWTLTSPQGLGWCEPQSQKWTPIVRVCARVLSTSDRFCAGCLNIHCEWCCLGLFFFLSSPLLSMCQHATALQLFHRYDSVCPGQGFRLCCLIIIRINHIRIHSGSLCVHVPPFFVTPIS